MPLNNCPIGVFDSGVGGLTIVKALAEEMPGEDMIYVGDTAHVPYGDKNFEQLLSYGVRIIDFLLEQNVKMIIAACGTHSSTTLPLLTKKCPVPLLGVVKPGVKGTIRTTRNRRIAVMATAVTTKSGAYGKEITKVFPDARVWEIACPKLVPLIEAGITDGPAVEDPVREYLDEPLSEGIDTVVLGCTHYPYLMHVISRITGDLVEIVDPARETIVEVKSLLAEGSGFNSGNQGNTRYFATGSADSFFSSGKMLIGTELTKVETINLESKYGG
ncbi:MAG: glutamate racemase [Chitinophagales bacterium]